MNISVLSITRPVLATVISIVIVLFGIIGFVFLGVREFPSVDPPVVTVTTNYIGANADVVESQITEPLEESVNGIAGIRSLTSVSSDGRSTITVEFELGIDMELSDIANNVFKERLQTIPGVSEVRIWGEKKYSIKLYMDPVKLAGYRLTPGDIRTALIRENVELPSGRIEGYGTELTIRTRGRLTTPAEFNDMIICESDGTVIRMKDVGRAVLAPENEHTNLRGNGAIPMVGVAITPQPGANQIDIADEAYKRVDQIKKELPGDLHVGLAMDNTKSIRKAISEVEDTILLAFILVVLVIFVFLRSWRTTIIPVIAIPISLVSSFFIMYVAGFSINILTLLGIVLATGLVVDDAIVVLENIYHKIETGIIS